MRDLRANKYADRLGDSQVQSQSQIYLTIEPKTSPSKDRNR